MRHTLAVSLGTPENRAIQKLSIIIIVIILEIQTKRGITSLFIAQCLFFSFFFFFLFSFFIRIGMSAVTESSEESINSKQTKIKTTLKLQIKQF